MKITSELLKQLGASPANAAKYAQALEKQTKANNIDTPLRRCHFLAQVFHESSNLHRVRENMNYSEKGLLDTFPKYFKPKSLAKEYARQPERIGNHVYANRMGNGNEASGDGYRYRGRGLIQLTGKDNYRDFGAWLGEDVVAAPDRVATDFAVESAIYFWTANNLNQNADSDDLLTITQKINGGTKGLKKRRQLLLRAKQLAGHVDARLESPTHRVTANQLNLRSTPEVRPGNRIGTLSQGTLIEKLGNTDTPNWIRVRTVLSGRVVEGVLHDGYIEKLPAATPVAAATPEPVVPIPVVHLRQDNRDVTRAVRGKWAHPLGETGLPRRKGATPAAKTKSLLKIAQTLAPNNPAHLRYVRTSNYTYCNVYAHDFCYLANVYLPRVWWKGPALIRLARGEAVDVLYGQTVEELRANHLHDWLDDFGPSFGWTRQNSLDLLQAAANVGEVGIIVAKTKKGEPGHIAAVLPSRVRRPCPQLAQYRRHRYSMESKARDRRMAPRVGRRLPRAACAERL